MHYNQAFIALRPILSDEDRALLHALDADYPLAALRSDVRSFEELAVDFVHTSAKIEGNTYDRVDTDNLLRMGVTAGGKRYSDAVMLMNLRDAYARVMNTQPGDALDFEYLCSLHAVLMKDLLPAHEQGIGRTTAVRIGATKYEPLADAQRLRTEMKFVLECATQYEDPFERAIYLHCNVAYLQFFRDGNKRTARLMQTAALVEAGRLPLFFDDELIDRYQRATVRYYETGEYAPFVSFFKDNHALAISRLCGEPCPRERESSDVPPSAG